MWERVVVVVGNVNDITWKTLVRSITISILDLFRSILYKCAWHKNAIYIAFLLLFSISLCSCLIYTPQFITQRKALAAPIVCSISAPCLFLFSPPLACLSLFWFHSHSRSLIPFARPLSLCAKQFLEQNQGNFLRSYISVCSLLSFSFFLHSALHFCVSFTRPVAHNQQKRDIVHDLSIKCEWFLRCMAGSEKPNAIFRFVFPMLCVRFCCVFI